MNKFNKRKQHKYATIIKMKKKIILLIVMVILIILSYFVIQKYHLTGNSIRDPYIHTKAICNESNFCQDYEIVCQSDKLIAKSEITGAFVQQDSNWQDPRENKNLCD